MDQLSRQFIYGGSWWLDYLSALGWQYLDDRGIDPSAMFYTELEHF